MRVILFLTGMAFLAACGRPLTEAERRFASDIHGASIDTSKIRVLNGALVGSITTERQKRPRLACRERIFPEPTSEIVTVAPAAMVLYNRIFYARDWYQPDYIGADPEVIDLFSAMVLVHEVTHVWQWQNRTVTGYSPLRAAREHGGGRDPYLFDITTQTRFLDYAYEQQASIVEEYVCCATLDPDAPRTQRLEAMLKGAFPLQELQLPEKVRIPWEGVKVNGICR